MIRPLVLATTFAVLSTSAAGSTLSIVLEGTLGTALPGHTFRYAQIHAGEQVVGNSAGGATFGQGELYVANGFDQSDVTSTLSILDASGLEVFAYAFDGFDSNDSNDGFVQMGLVSSPILNDRGSLQGREYLGDGSRVLASFSYVAPFGTIESSDPLQPSDISFFDQSDLSAGLIEAPGLGVFSLNDGTLDVTNFEISTVIIPLPPSVFLGAAGLGAVVIGRRRLGTERRARRTAV